MDGLGGRVFHGILEDAGVFDRRGRTVMLSRSGSCGTATSRATTTG